MDDNSLFVDHRLNKKAVTQLLNKPECGIERVPVDDFRFSSTLPYVRNERGLFYHPDHFFIDLRHDHVWIRSGVEIGPNGGWHWKTEVHKTYRSCDVETFSDLLRVLAEHIPAMKDFPHHNLDALDGGSGG
ncbi:MAG: hypothetical protein FOGNACKC_00781 [Anaerolineae bacterium]|nr:hypothetical protein [Anaerolineae bacterium]